MRQHDRMARGREPLDGWRAGLGRFARERIRPEPFIPEPATLGAPLVHPKRDQTRDDQRASDPDPTLTVHHAVEPITSPARSVKFRRDGPPSQCCSFIVRRIVSEILCTGYQRVEPLLAAGLDISGELPDRAETPADRV
jgi:hypothetical protein